MRLLASGLALRVALGVACAAASMGCSSRARQHCALGKPVPIATTSGLGFDGIAMTVVQRAGRSEPRYAWSDEAGLWARGATDARSRVGERCRGGLALAADYVACSRPGTEDEGEVVVFAVDDALKAGPSIRVGRAGRDGRGVALAVRGKQVWVAHHDGSRGAHTVVLTRLEGGRVQGQTVLSHAGQIASAPALTLDAAGHAYVAFSEADLSSTEPGSSVWLSRDGGPARLVVKPRAYATTPKLVADARGLVLAYRDRARAARLNSTRNELYVARLGADLGLLAPPRAVGRANTEHEPFLVDCGKAEMALLPREYGGERYVGIHALDPELNALGAGHQLYANGREFVQASGSCAAGDDAWYVFAADRALPGRPGSRAVMASFRCE